MDVIKPVIARLETAEEGSRELDEAIAFAIQWRPPVGHTSALSFSEHEKKHDYSTAWIAHKPWHSSWPIPIFTTSLDAALTLGRTADERMQILQDAILLFLLYQAGAIPDEPGKFLDPLEHLPRFCCCAALKARVLE